MSIPLARLAMLDPPNEAIYPANGAPTEFAYDGAGNRTDFEPKSGGAWLPPHTTYGYGPLKQRLLTIRLDSVTVESLGGYDGNGNPGTWTPPSSTARTLKFDALGPFALSHPGRASAGDSQATIAPFSTDLCITQHRRAR